MIALLAVCSSSFGPMSPSFHHMQEKPLWPRATDMTRMAVPCRRALQARSKWLLYITHLALRGCSYEEYSHKMRELDTVQDAKMEAAVKAAKANGSLRSISVNGSAAVF